MKSDHSFVRITKAHSMLFILLGLVVLSSSCNSAPPTYASDCGWEVTAESWIDDNQNGIWDTTEQPLAGVSFFVDDIANQEQKVNGEDVSNKHGKANITVFLPGCPDVKFEVYSVAPKNCKPTTYERILANQNTQEEVLSFGFYCQ